MTGLVERAQDLGVEIDDYDPVDVSFVRLLDRLEALTAAGGRLADAVSPLSTTSDDLEDALRSWDEIVAG